MNGEHRPIRCADIRWCRASTTRGVGRQHARPRTVSSHDDAESREKALDRIGARV